MTKKWSHPLPFLKIDKIKTLQHQKGIAEPTSGRRVTIIGTEGWSVWLYPLLEMIGINLTEIFARSIFLI